MKKNRRFSAAFASIFGLALAGSTASTLAQTTVTLDGTSGNKTISTNYSTTGGLTLGLGFFADYLVVGGGGSGGTPGGSGGQDTWGTGGGGGGGMLTGNTQLSSSNYAVTVGAGGTAPSYNASSTTRGNNGGNSTFNTFTAIGGGGGGGGESSFSGVGASGGSGGGGGSKYSNAGGAGTASQGNSGGNARNGDTSSAGGRTAGGGGGGAGQAGFTPASGSSTGGRGGNGTASSITGSSVTYAGGGGGGARDTNGGQTAGAGGTGGGGAGATTSSAGNGTNGLGGGGGGRGADGVGGNGGSGIVIVRYEGASLGNIGGTVTPGTGTAAGYTLHTFSSTGSSSLDLSGVNMPERLGANLVTSLTGTGSMTYNGPGTLRLSASSHFTGETRIANGTLVLANSYALVFSTLNMTGSDSGALSFQPGNNTYLLGGLKGSRDIAMGGNWLTIGGNNETTTYSGNISGSSGLSKVGTGTLTLSGNNTYSGKTYVGPGGTLVTNGDNRLGTSKIVDIWNGGTLRLGGNETFEKINFYGNIIVDSNAFLTYAPTDPATHASGFYNSISGDGGFIKDGASSVSLVTSAGSANKTYTYTGDTIINAGTLWTQAENQLPTGNTVIVNSGAAFGLTGNQTLGAVTGSGTVYMYRNNLTVGATSGAFSGSLVGSGNLIKNGAGTLTLSGNSSGSFTGDADITGGTLVLNSANALSTDAVITMSAGTTLTVNQRTFVGAIDQGGGTVNGPGELVATLTSTSSGSLNAVIADGIDFSAGILKRTGGTTTVGAANTFTGAVKVQGGTLQLTGSGSFSSASSLVTSTGATMDLNNKSQTFSKVSGTGGTVALGSGTLTVNQASDSEYGGAITGSGGFVKSGAGNLTLSGASTYLGATTVSAGELVVDGSLASATTVQNGATLSGSGSVGGLIINSGATVNPGNSPGTLTVNGNAVWNAGGNYDWESMATNTNQSVQTAAGTDWDFMDITGTLTLSGLSIGNEFNLNLTSLVDTLSTGEIPDWDPNVGSTWLIASAAGGIYVNSGLIGANQNYSSLFNINTAGWTGSLPIGGFQVITLGSTTDLYLQAVASAAVPEPGQVAASLLLLAGIGGYVWMKRRKRVPTTN